ncbi:MAG: AraC family transcriptional regulator [Pseudomonadota bacterium]
MSLYLEIFFRFVSIGLVSGVCALMLRAKLRPRIFRYALGLNLAVIAVLLTAGTSPWVLQGPHWTLLNVFTTYLFPFAWLFGLALFQENFRLGSREWTVIAVYTIPPIFYLVSLLGFQPGWIGYVRIAWLLMSLGMMLHLIYFALSGRAQDLVESRRRERIWVASGIGVFLIIVYAASESLAVFSSIENQRFLYLLGAAYGLWMLLWLARVQPDVVAFHPALQAAPPAFELDPRDVPIKARLDALMDVDLVYREQGLTIRALADKVGVPEHQLRALINRSMGYRNFSSYLNQYRIGDAKRVLSDPEQARLPVLTIAMDVGYASLTPFNNAFKAIVGKTPTVFRSEALKLSHGN